MDTTTISAAFQSLPAAIKDWLASEELVYKISDLESRFGIDYPKDTVIPDLILKLCTQVLDPRDFINELGLDLDISFQSATHLTQEIEDRCLKSIKSSLRQDVGVDLGQLYFGQPAPRRVETRLPSEPMEVSKEPANIKPAELPIVGPNLGSWLKPIPKAPISAVPQPEGKKEPIPANKQPIPKIIEPIAGPRIDLQRFQIKDNGISAPIKKESPLPTAPIAPVSAQQPIAPKIIPPPEISKASSSETPATPFILHAEEKIRPISQPVIKESPRIDLKPTRDFQSITSAPKPVTVKVESPKQEKIVHYSSFLTPLTTLGTEKKPESKKEDPVLPNKNSGRVVDLRPENNQKK